MPGVCGCGVWERGNVGGVWCGCGVRLRAGEGEFVRMGGQWGYELGCCCCCWVGVEDGGRPGKGPGPPALPDPMEPPAAPGPGAEEADCAAGLLAGREGGVDIWFCCRTTGRT